MRCHHARYLPLLVMGTLLTACRSKQPIQDAARSNSSNDSVFERVVEVAPEQAKRVKIYYKDAKGVSYGSLANLFEQMKAKDIKPKALINGGMVDIDGKPVGLLIVDGNTIRGLNMHNGKENFSMGKHGVFAITKSGKALVFNPAERRSGAFLRSLKYATQSGPLLVSHGKIVAGKDWNRLNSRSAVGVTKAGGVVFVQSASIGLRAFAEACRKRGMWDALFLDGGGYSCVAREPSEANFVQRYAGIISVE
ncbi:MAG: phosphodiester glycosidase family protein [Armatimonadetes bacterium]|nr:phosphodiester glycosidase family protein [Armatimonadota bacterium]